MALLHVTTPLLVTLPHASSGLCGGYAIVMLFNPVRRALARWISLHRAASSASGSPLLCSDLAYFVFQFATFTPIQNWADLDPNQIISLAALALAAIYRDMARNAVARARRRGGNFR